MPAIGPKRSHEIIFYFIDTLPYINGNVSKEIKQAWIQSPEAYISFCNGPPEVKISYVIEISDS